MIAPEFVGLATDILPVPFLVLSEKAGFVGVKLEEWKLDTFRDLHESQRFGLLCMSRDCWSRFGCSGLPLSLGLVAQGTVKSWSVANMAKKLESVNARKGMVDFEKFKQLCSFLLFRQRGRLSAPRWEPLLFLVLCS